MLKEKPIEEKIQDDDNAKFEGHFKIKFSLPPYPAPGPDEGLGRPSTECSATIPFPVMRKMIDLTNLYR